jgi:hypothetical protein
MAAGFGADPAVRMYVGVALAFLGAELTRDDARMELRMHELVRRFSLPREDARGGAANVGAVEVRVDAAPKLFEVMRLAKAGIGARGARRGASLERIQSLDVVMRVLSVSPRMAPQH